MFYRVDNTIIVLQDCNPVELIKSTLQIYGLNWIAVFVLYNIFLFEG